MTNYQYVVDAHTGGLELQLADQLSGQHLLTGMVSYITSNTLRYFNDNYFNTGSQQVSNFTNGSECFATYKTRRLQASAIPRRATRSISQGTFRRAVRHTSTPQDPCTDGELSPSAPACVDGATMLLTYLGNTADINAVVPKLTDASIADQWRPSDRWNINGSVRFENDAYGLADTNNPATNFWFAAAQREFCVNPVTRQPIFIPQPPQSIFFFTPFATFNCPIDRSTGTPIQTVHPNGTDGILLDQRLSVVVRPVVRRAALLGDLHRQSRHGAARLGRPLRAAAAELRDPVQHACSRISPRRCSGSSPSASTRRCTRRRRSSRTTTISRTSIISAAPTWR